MKNLLKKVMQVLSVELTRYEQLRVNDENEYLVMTCGAFSPRFLAQIKRSKIDARKKMGRKEIVARMRNAIDPFKN